MNRWRCLLNYRVFLRLAAAGFLILAVAACQKKLEPEHDCNFVQNSSYQRVSWKNELLRFYVHESVPVEYYPVIRNAADSWNAQLGREVITIEIEGVAGDVNNRKDNISMIYLLDVWDNDNLREQARTSVRWRGTQIIEADILLNNQYFDFSVAPKTPLGMVDLESLILHEMGHALGLAHVDDHNSVMYPQLARGQDRRVIADLDVESLTCEYAM